MCPLPRKTKRPSRPIRPSSPPFVAPFAVPVQPVLEELSLSPASDVLEIGSISCRFTLPIARYFATKKGTGTVYLCEPDEDAALRTYQKARDAHLTHLVVPLHWDPATSVRIPCGDLEIDVIIAISSPAFRTQAETFLSECFRVLRQNGKLFVAEWRDIKTINFDRSSQELSREDAWAVLNATSGVAFTEVDIPELEWAALVKKSEVPVTA